jgi:hypothetical protein
MYKKMHIWPFKGTPHSVNEKHTKAPKGATHWNKSEFILANNKYKEGV